MSAQVKRYFMRATSVKERVGDEKCDCYTPCQCVVYATDFDAVEAERDTLTARVALLEQRIAELEPGAECWDAIAKCDRITCMGWAELGRPDDAGLWPLPKEPGYAHATFNLWTGSPPRKDEQDNLGRDVLAHFVAKAILNAKASAALSPAQAEEVRS